MNEHQTISFPAWNESLAAAALPGQLREQHRRAILSFLRHCKVTRQTVTIAGVKAYLARLSPAEATPAREALLWFFKASRSDSSRAPDSAVGRISVTERSDSLPSRRSAPPVRLLNCRTRSLTWLPWPRPSPKKRSPTRARSSPPSPPGIPERQSSWKRARIVRLTARQAGHLFVSPSASLRAAPARRDPLRAAALRPPG